MQSAAAIEKEDKLRQELKSTADSWRWKFNLPQKPNYNNVYYYKKSKKIFNAPCYDLDMDKPPDSYKGEFLQVKNELHHTEYRLKRAQDEARNKKQDLAQQWKDLETQELQLRNNFVQFNKFLMKNTAKRTRAEQKFQEMKALKVECTENIAEMRSESVGIKEVIEKIKKKISDFKIYEDYLMSVVMTGSFKTITHVINRYTLLEETKQAVGRQMNEMSEEYHTRRQLYVKLLETSELTFLSLANELSEMRRKYDDAKNRTNAWEKVLNDICNKYEAVAQNISWSRMALRHMFDMAFFRVRRRRRWLVKKKKDDLGKMLRINETLKALEKIEWQMRKLYGQKEAGTSMDPELESFRVEEKDDSDKPRDVRMSSLMGKWKAKGKSVQISGRMSPVEPGAFFKTSVESEKLEDICTIRLPPAKWEKAKVRNFEERYKKALLAIREEKLADKMRELTYGSSPRNVSTTSLNLPKSHKGKWAAAAVAQKIAREAGERSHRPIPAPMSAVVTASSESVVTVFEDRYDADLYREEECDALSKRQQLKKLIERKFTYMLDSPRGSHEQEQRERKQSVFPVIPSKDKETWQRKTQAHVKISFSGKLPSMNNRRMTLSKIH